MSDMQINEQWLQEALSALAQIGPAVETIQAAIDAGFIPSAAPAPAPAPVAAPAPAPAPAAAPAPVVVTQPLTKAERKEVFVEQRTAELEAANKPVNTAALEKRFDDLSKTVEGRATITEVVQRAEPTIIQTVAPTKVQIQPAPAVAPKPTPAPAVAPKPTPAPITEESLTSLRESLAQIGPTAKTIQTAIDKGIVPPQFTPTPASPVQSPTVGGDDTGGGDTGTGKTENPIARQMMLDREAALEAARIERTNRQRDARTTITEMLQSFGLGELADYTYREIIAQDVTNPDVIMFRLREQPAYQRRFAANAVRARKGLAELDPASYIALENQYRETLRSNGLPANFYDQTEDFTALLEGDVSPSELNERVQQGYRAVADADPAVKRQMQQLYGVGDAELAAYFLDPERAAPLLTRQARAAQIAARGAEQGGIQLTGALAEDLARRGITEAEAQRGFAEIGALGELRQTFAGETALSTEQLVGAQFNQNIQAQQELERRRRLRTAEFAGGGQFARTTGATSGSIETGVGTAQ